MNHGKAQAWFSLSSSASLIKEAVFHTGPWWTPELSSGGHLLCRITGTGVSVNQADERMQGEEECKHSAV